MILRFSLPTLLFYYRLSLFFSVFPLSLLFCINHISSQFLSSLFLSRSIHLSLRHLPSNYFFGSIFIVFSNLHLTPFLCPSNHCFAPYIFPFRAVSVLPSTSLSCTLSPLLCILYLYISLLVYMSLSFDCLLVSHLFLVSLLSLPFSLLVSLLSLHLSLSLCLAYPFTRLVWPVCCAPSTSLLWYLCCPSPLSFGLSVLSPSTSLCCPSTSLLISFSVKRSLCWQSLSLILAPILFVLFGLQFPLHI
jgi:hypothetical protein